MGPWRWAVLPRAVLVCIGLTGFGWALGHKAALAAERTEGPTTLVTEPHSLAKSPAADPSLAPSADALSCDRIRAVKLLGDAGEDLPFLSFALEPLITGSERILGQCLTATQKRQIVQRVHQTLIEQGYLTTTVEFAPEVADPGVIKLLIHPGRLGVI